MNFSLGWNQPTEKHYARAARLAGPPVHALGLPPPATSSDLSALVQILDQGQLGSCVLNAEAQIIRAAQIQAGVTNPEFLSRLFSYYMARVEDGNQATDAGTQLCTALDAICRMGFCKESKWPYDPTWFASMPPEQAIHDALDQRRTLDLTYNRIEGQGADRSYQVRQVLTSGGLVAFGMPAPAGAVRHGAAPTV